SFAGASLVSLISNGERAVAIGYRANAGAPRTWASSDGVKWQETSAPGLFGGGTPPLAAGGGLGLAVAGYAPASAPAATAVGMWHSKDGVAWSPEAQPM